MGQASTQRPQRMQVGSAETLFSLPANASTAPVPLATGKSADACAIPIIGPPAMSLNVSSFRPPQASKRRETGVPIGHSKFFGSTTPLPDTVTTLRTTGMPSLMAW